MLNQASPTFQVISVWGMDGLGKTTVIKDIYQIKPRAQWNI
jgi:ABC-type cobalamin/Fe3+-siderophores transport system ATPase subunit